MSVAEAYGFNFASESCEKLVWSKYPCRKCIPCLIARQKAWVSRLTEELENHENNYFVTLTYDDSFVPVSENGEMTFNKQHLIKLNRDLRKRFQQGFLSNPYKDVIAGSPATFDLPKDVHYKYYITSEYGPSGTFRPHYHAVFYGLQVPIHVAELLFRELWPYGFVSVFPAEAGAAGYISKYLVTDGVGKNAYNGTEHEDKPFALMSKGLGLSYVERMGDFHRADTRRMYVQKHGIKSRMDRYLKHKIYDEDTLSEYADKCLKQHSDLKNKYAYFQSEHPLLYVRLMEERAAYFQEQRDSIRWKTIKQHSLK